MADQRKLSETQFQLLVIKDMTLTKARQDFQQTLNVVGIEQGIENLSEWALSKDGKYLIKTDVNGEKK